MPEVKAITSFFDVAEKRARNAGDEFFCEDERAKKLAAYGMVEVLGLPKEPAVEEEPETAEPEPIEEAEEPKPEPKKRTRKKAE